MKILTKNILGRENMDRKRISVSHKRQITIPIKFHEMLGISSEVDCYIKDGALIIKPIRPEYTGEFAVEILSDLVAQGLSGEQLLVKFTEMNQKVRPAVELLITEADAIALTNDQQNKFQEIFGTEN